MHWAVILAGGSGTRFWPLSTPSRPKQVLPLVADGRSTAGDAVSRLAGLIPPERTLVVTGAALAGPLRDTLGLSPANLLVEPRAASTAPALVWAAHEAIRRDPTASLLCLHADWYVPEPEAFRDAARQALEAGDRENRLITVGITPTRAETGYGYIAPGETLPSGARRVARFTEKPGPETAAQLVHDGALWNSGLFAWPAQLLLAETVRHTPEIGPHLPLLDRGDVPAFFAAVTPISIDVGLLERSDRVAVVPGSFAWDDIGTWDALARVRPRDLHGNVIVGDAHLVDTTGCIVWTDGTPVVTSGIHDLVIVAANGRILVMDRARAAGLKEVLDRLPPMTRAFPE